MKNKKFLLLILFAFLLLVNFSFGAPVISKDVIYNQNSIYPSISLYNDTAKTPESRIKDYRVNLDSDSLGHIIIYSNVTLYQDGRLFTSKLFTTITNNTVQVSNYKIFIKNSTTITKEIIDMGECKEDLKNGTSSIYPCQIGSHTEDFTYEFWSEYKGDVMKGDILSPITYQTRTEFDKPINMRIDWIPCVDGVCMQELLWVNNVSWTSRSLHTINLAGITAGENLTNFPYRVFINASTVNLSLTRTDGCDFRFTDAGGNLELNHTNPIFINSSDVVFDVRVPSISNITNTSIYIYYNNPSATCNGNPNGVYDDDYRIVSHLNDSGDAGSTRNIPNDKTFVGISNMNGTLSGTTPASAYITGIIANRLSLTGSAVRSEVNYSDPDLIPSNTLSFTFEGFWQANAEETTERNLFDFENNGAINRLFRAITNENNVANRVTFQTFDDIGVNLTNLTVNLTNLTVNSYLTFTGISNGELAIYVNGTKIINKTIGNLSIPVQSNNGNHLGSDRTGTSNLYKGNTQEFRVSASTGSTAKRSDKWIKAEYLSLTNRLGFTGAQENLGSINVSLVSPVNNNQTNNATIFLNASIITTGFTVNNLTFFAGNFTQFNTTNNGINNFSYNWTYTFADGNYTWNVTACGNSSTTITCFSSNTNSFYVDATPPTINLTMTSSFTTPTILSTFSVADAGIGLSSCYYNVSNSTGNVLSNIPISSCSTNTSLVFNVPRLDTYNFTLFANDSLGNSNSTRFSFISQTPAVQGGNPTNPEINISNISSQNQESISGSSGQGVGTFSSGLIGKLISATSEKGGYVYSQENAQLAFNMLISFIGVLLFTLSALFWRKVFRDKRTNQIQSTRVILATFSTVVFGYLLLLFVVL